MSKISRRELAMVEQLRQERQGTAGMAQCPGCPDPCLVPEGTECWKHTPQHPDAWMSYEPGPDEGYDVAGRL